MSRFETKSSHWKAEILIVLANFRNAILGWSIFITNFVMNIAGALANVCVFYFLASITGSAMAPYLAEYGASYDSVVLWGIITSIYLNTSLNALYITLCYGYWSNTLELYSSSPVGIKAYMIGGVLFEYFISTISTVLFITVGVAFFHIYVNPNLGHLTVVVLAVLGNFATIGLGLIAASTFTLLNAKGWQNPVSWFLDILINLTSGVYFPVALLPSAIQIVSYSLPQTYTYEAIRLAILRGLPLDHPAIIANVYPLIILSFITIPTGILLFRRSLLKAEKDGTLSRWV